MKKVLAAAIMCAFMTFAQAQTAAPAATTAAPAPKKEKKVKAPKEATATAPATAPTAAPAATPKKVKTAANVATPANDDIVKGTDDKGRTIYEGPKGGQYYINSNGNKSYLKADKKMQ